MKLTFLLTVSILLLVVACDSSNAALQSEIDSLKSQLAEAQSATPKRPGLVHTVFFWLKDGVTAEQKAAFMDGCRTLAAIPSVQASYIGPHADTEERDVVDHSYDLAYILHFENQAAQDSYQVDPVHLAFIEKHSDLWEKVLVYDSQVQ